MDEAGRGGGGAEQYFEVDGERVMVESRMTVQGSGSLAGLRHA